ncbi:MAG: hypothetical protein ABSF69_11030 [Polyangiaceae bacterium]|jgi:hypothetical protein
MPSTARLPRLREMSLRTHGRGVAFAVGTAFSMVGCEPDVHITSKMAPDFRPAQHAVSVFGVYKDGQLSSDSWGAVKTQLSPVFGGGICEAAYTESFITANPALSTAIADVSRDNGFSDALLAQIAVGARGDLVLVLTVAGRLPTHGQVSLPKDAETHHEASPIMGARTGIGRSKDPNAIDLAATLFSVPEHRSVAIVGIRYTGRSVDEGVAQFVARLAQALPGARCADWNWANKPDAESVRQTANQD